MKRNIEPVYYGDYLQLSKLLDSQSLQSERYGEPAHEEMLFVIVHQVYELWFKQVLHEIDSVLSVFDQGVVKDQQLTTLVHRLNRVIRIQRLMNDQIEVMETMSPQEFLAFRDYLIPASGFQSMQFKRLEIGLGLKRHHRVKYDQSAFYSRLTEEDRQALDALESRSSLLEHVDQWLARMPFLEMKSFKFWDFYHQATEKMLASDREHINNNQTLTPEEKAKELEELEKNAKVFEALLDADAYAEYQQQGQFRISQKAMLAALFINQYREEPVFNLPHQFITCLTEIDENLTLWRYRHAMMVHRMLGGKIGTGGSSGHDYLRRSTESNRIFTDFFNMATFLLPKAALPALPDSVARQLGYFFTNEA